VVRQVFGLIDVLRLVPLGAGHSRRPLGWSNKVRVSSRRLLQIIGVRRVCGGLAGLVSVGLKDMAVPGDGHTPAAVVRS